MEARHCPPCLHTHNDDGPAALQKAGARESGKDTAKEGEFVIRVISVHAELLSLGVPLL